MNAIGGYFELELEKGGSSYHTTSWFFKSGRSSLHFILKELKPALVYIPYYTCKGLLEPFEAAGIAYRFYEIDQHLEPKALPTLKEDQLFLYVNYFDVKRGAVEMLSERYADRLIVDCSQAFFMKGNGRSWYFNSCRKFFGVPDGSYLYKPDDYKLALPQSFQRNEDYYFDHLLKRFNGYPGEGYETFIKNEVACGSEIKCMSKISEYLLSHVDYYDVAAKRRANFNYLHNTLGELNGLQLAPQDVGVPLCYPLLLHQEINRELLIERNLFIPTFWKDVLNREINGFEMERSIVERLLPLPVDHRYGVDDMAQVVNTLNLLNNVPSLS